MLHGDPLRGRKLFDDPVAAKTPEPAVLLAAERVIGEIVHGLVMEVSHAHLHLERKG